MEKDNEDLSFIEEVNNGNEFVIGKTYEVLEASSTGNFQIGALIFCVEANPEGMGYAKFTQNNDSYSMYLYNDDRVIEFTPIKKEEIASTLFKKFDTGKTRLSLIEPNFIEGVGKVLTFGAEKYEANGWQNLPEEELYRYKDALMRHILEHLKQSGSNDLESGISHLHHAACNIMFLAYFEEQEKLKG